MKFLQVLSGGAAQGLVTQLQDQFQLKYQCAIDGTFGAVGMMKDSLLAGTHCDVIILTEALIAQLAAGGQVLGASVRKLGVVKTGIAVKAGEKSVDVRTPESLKATLLSARGLYFPDPVKSTAGIHVMKVLNQLGIADELAGRLRPFPNGATAMKAMAETNGPGLLGCTQITEILYADGVELVAALPTEFELATTYTAAVCSQTSDKQVAQGLIEMLLDPEAAALRRACGFEA
jgi:molybdate transport system substrate-binding protein